MSSSSELHGPQQQNEEQHQTQSQLSSTAMIFEPHHPSPVKMVRKSASMAHQKDMSVASHNNITPSTSSAQDTSVAPPNLQNVNNNNNSNNSVSVSRRTSPHQKNNNERQEKVVVHSPQQQQQKYEQRRPQGPFTVRVDPRSIAGNIKVTHNNSIHSQPQPGRKKSSGPSTSSRTNTRPQLRTKTPPVSSSGNHKIYLNNNNNNSNRNENNDPNVIHQNNNHQPHASSSSSLLYPPPFRIGASHTLHSFEQLSHRKKSPEEVREEIHEQHQHSQQLKMKGDRYFDAPQRRGPSPRELAEQKAFHSKLLPPGSSWTSSPAAANKIINKKSTHRENNFEFSTSDEEIVGDVYSRLYPKRLTAQQPLTMNNKQQHHQENQNPKSHHTKSAPVVIEGDYYEPSGESSDSLEKKQKQQQKGRNLSTIQNNEKIDEERVDDDDEELYNDEELLEVQEELMELQALLNDQQAKLKQKLQQRINELKSSKKIKTGNQTKNDNRKTEQRNEPVVIPSKNISRTGRQISERKVLPNSAVARTNSIRSNSGSNKSDDSNRKITNQKNSVIPPQPHTPGKTLPSCNNNDNDRASKSKFINAEVSGRALNYYPLGLAQQQLYPPHQKNGNNHHQPHVSKPQTENTTKNTSSSSSPFANKKLNHQNYPNNSMSGATPIVMNHFYFSGNANSGNKKRTITPPPSIHSTKKTDYSNVKSRLFEATASSTRKTKESNKNDDENDNTNRSGYHNQQQQRESPVQKFKMHFKTSNPQNSDFARKDSSFKRSQTTPPPPPASDRSGMKQRNVGTKNKDEDEEEKDFNPELFASASMFHRSNINTSSFSRTKSAPTGASGSRNNNNNNNRQSQSQQNMTSQRGVPSQPPVFADHVASRVQQIWQDKEQQKPEQQQQQQQSKQSPSSSFNKSKNQSAKTSNSKREQQPNFWNSARKNENSNQNDNDDEVEVQRPFRAGRERRVNTPPPTLNRNNNIVSSNKNGSGSRTGSASSRKSDSNRSDAPSANFVQLPIPHTPGMPNNKMNINKSQSDSHLSRIKPVKVATRFYRKEEIDLDDDEDDSSSIHVSNTKNGSRHNSSSRNRDDIIQGNNNNTNKNGIIVDVIPPQPKTPGMVTKQSNNQSIIKPYKNDFHARNERNENFFTDNNQQRSTQKQQFHQKNKQAQSPTVDHGEGTKKKNSPNIVIYEKFPASKTNNNSNTRDPMLSSTGDEFALPREGIQIPRPTTPPPPRPKRQQSDQLYGYSHEENSNNRNESLRSHANVSGFGIASASANSIAFPIAPLPPTNISPAPHWTSEDHNNNNHNHMNSSTPGNNNNNNNKREIVNVAELVEALSARRGLNRQQQRSGDDYDDDGNAPSPNPVDPRGLARPEPAPNNHQTKHVEKTPSIHKNAKIDDKKHEELVKHSSNSQLSSRSSSSSSSSASTEKTNNSTLASQSTVSINDLIAAAANDLGVPSGPMVENKNTSHSDAQANPKLPFAAAAASTAFEPHSVHPKSPLPRRGVATASQQEKEEKEQTKKLQIQSQDVDAAVLRIPTDEERKQPGDGVGVQQESVRPIVEEVDEDVDDEELERRRAARQKSKNNNDDDENDSAGNDEVDRNTQDERLDAARKVQASQKNYQNHGNLNAENLNINNTSKNVGQGAEPSKKKSPSSDPLTSRVLAYDDGVF